MSDFWARQRAKQAAQNPPPAPADPLPGVPWWARGTNLIPDHAMPKNVAPEQTQSDTGRIDGHDISRAEFLRGKAQECPNCPVNPETGVRGNMYKASSSTAWRCFDCGYVDGREIHDSMTGQAATTEGPAQRAKQIDRGGFTADPYAQQSMARPGVDQTG